MRSGIVLACFAVLATAVCAQGQGYDNDSYKPTWVNGYFKKNGSYVQGHYRGLSTPQIPKFQNYMPKWHEGTFNKNWEYKPGHYSYPGGSLNPYKPYTTYKPYVNPYNAYKPYSAYKTYNPFKRSH